MIIDGYDDLKREFRNYNLLISNNLKAWGSQNRVSTYPKVIITSRMNALSKNYKSIFKFANEDFNLLEVEFSFFGEDMQQEYLSKYL